MDKTLATLIQDFEDQLSLEDYHSCGLILGDIQANYPMDTNEEKILSSKFNTWIYELYKNLDRTPENSLIIWNSKIIIDIIFHTPHLISHLDDKFFEAAKRFLRLNPKSYISEEFILMDQLVSVLSYFNLDIAKSLLKDLEEHPDPIVRKLKDE